MGTVNKGKEGFYERSQPQGGLNKNNVEKVDISSVFNHDRKTFLHTPNKGVELDPYYYKEYPDFLTPEECDKLAEIILRDEQDILSIPNASGKPYEGLTLQHEVYNWFNHKDVALLNIPQRLLALEEFNTWNSWLVQCWTNVSRQHEFLSPHFHTWQPLNHLYACNIFIAGNPNTGTHYEGRGRVTNKIGALTIVGQRLEHQVKSNIYQTPRISMAVDIMTTPTSYMRNEQSFTERYVYYRNDAVSETPLCMQL